MGLLTDFANGLSQDGQMTPAGQGLLAAGLGILAHNRGLTSGTAALGMGGLEGLQTYQGAKQQQMDQQLKGVQLQQAQLGLRRQQGIMNIYDRLRNSAQTEPQPGSLSPAPWTPGGMQMPATLGGPSLGVSPSLSSSALTPGGGNGLMPGAAFSGNTAPTLGPSQDGGPFGYLPPDVAQAGVLLAPEKLIENSLDRYKATDLIRMQIAAGINPSSPEGQQMLRDHIRKENYIPPTSIRGQVYADAQGIHSLPAPAQDGYQNFQQVPGDDHSWYTAQVPGGTAAITGREAAKTLGQAQGELVQVQGDNGQPVWKPKSEVLAAGGGGAGGGNPATGNSGLTPFQSAIAEVESHNNPSAKNPASGAEGAMQVMPATKVAPGFGVMPARDNSPAERERVGRDYAGAMLNHFGNPIDAAIAYNWGPGNAKLWIDSGRKWDRLPLETQNFVGRLASQLQTSSASQQNGATGSGQQEPYAAAPAPGFAANADAAQKASAETMHKSYATLQSSNASANAALEALQKMQQLAQDKSMLSAGVLGTSLTAVNPSAAEYEKQRANVIALLAAQNGTNGSDAGRALTGESVPDYGKPKEAIHDGLQTLINQTRMQQLKGRVLTPVYRAGDSKAYTDLENEFDQNIGPGLMPVFDMPAGKQRAATLKTIAQDPKMRARLEWATQKGILK